MVKKVLKENGSLQDFDPSKITRAIRFSAAAEGVTLTDEQLDTIIKRTILHFPKKDIVPKERIEGAVIRSLRENDFEILADQYESYKGRTAHVHAKIGTKGVINSTDQSLLITADAFDSITTFDPERIDSYLKTNLPYLDDIERTVITRSVRNDVVEIYDKHAINDNAFVLSTDAIRTLVDAKLVHMGKDPEVVLHNQFGLPKEDLENIIISKSLENGNVKSNNPEAVAMGIWETILKKYALHSVFDKEVRDAHQNGEMHVHDLGYPVRLYCSAHSPGSLKLYGLDLLNLDTSSSPAKHAITLSGHLSTFLASMQANYAGALGISYTNLEFSPYLKGMSPENVESVKSKILDKLGGSDVKGSLVEFIKNYEKLQSISTKLGQQVSASQNLEEFITDMSSYITDTTLEKRFSDIMKKYTTMRETAKELVDKIGDASYIDNLMSAVEKELDNDQLIDDFTKLMTQYTDMKQVAQNLIFTQSQSAFSRGGQTLFIDFNVHPNVPALLADVPMICPSGKYRIKDRDGKEYNLIRQKDPESMDGLVFKSPIDDKVLRDGNRDFRFENLPEGFKFVTYKDYEREAQDFLQYMQEVWKEGDQHGTMFAFPKSDFHVDAGTFKNKRAKELLMNQCELAAENSSAYFIFDRDAVTMSACCRLRTSIDPKELDHPESIRFCGFQNVTVNIPQAAYRAKEKGKANLEGLMEEIKPVMDKAVKAHLQKREYIESLMQEGGPLYQVGKDWHDGLPYHDLDKATYIIGLIGLNDALNTIYGKEIHEGEEVLQNGLRVVSAMKQYATELAEKNALKISLEESPAESAARNLAKRDLKHKIYGKYAKEVIQGTDDDPYYANSIHPRADAPISGIDRIKMQSYFHPAIESGAIVHLFTGESEIDPEALYNLIENVYQNTQCAQLTVSGEHTFCKNCSMPSRGLNPICPHCSSEDVAMKEKVVGYNTDVRNVNDSKKLEFKQRQGGDYDVANHSMIDAENFDVDEDNPLVAVVYGKDGCGECDEIKEYLASYMNTHNINAKIQFEDMSDKGEKGIESWARAMRSNINPSSIPSVAFEYASNNGVYRPIDGMPVHATDAVVRRDRQTYNLASKVKKINRPMLGKDLENALSIAEAYLQE